MKTLEDQLSQYAAYHRHGGNVATHFIGIPTIVLAIDVLLSRPGLGIAGPLPLTAALLATVVAAAYYLWLDLGFGAVMTALLALSLGFGAWAAERSTPVWLALGLGGFVVGWVFQFVGHGFEGRKPAFLDDIAGLVIGPLFVVAEAAFLLGMRPALRRVVGARAGTIRHGAAGGGQSLAKL